MDDSVEIKFEDDDLPELPDPDDAIGDETSDQSLHDPPSIDPRDDPRELRFQLRRTKRKLKKLTDQQERLKKMAAMEALERTKLDIASRKASLRADTAERELAEVRRDHYDAARDLDRWRDAAQAAKKDIQEFQERRRKEREETRIEARGGLIEELLPVFDHMELAVSHAEADPADILKGVQMVMDQLDQAFERLLVERVPAEPGTQFSPELHEAMLHVEDTDAPVGTIVESLRPGYVMNGKLLRAARVTVAAPKHGAASSADEE